MNHLFKPSLPVFLLLLLSHASMPTASPPGADHGNDQDMLTIPEIASSFGASRTAAITSRTKNRRGGKGEFNGGCRGTNLAQDLDKKDLDKKAVDEKASHEKAWHEVVLQTLKRNDIRLVPYVPDRVLTTLIKNIHADPFFTTFPTAREEEAVGIVSGAWMGGMRGAVLMQTSGFATLANVLASLAIPYQIPLIMFVSERGTLGEFNYGQSLVCRTMRPVLDSLAMEHHTATRLDEFEFIVDRSIKQAITTQAPVALILSPLLTGGKVFDK